MATNANWTVIMDDKRIVKQTGDAAGTAYIISDDSFWSQSKYANIWAIQHGTSITSDEVEYRDETPHSSFADANIGDIQDFIDKWDSTHLATLQSKWDSNSQDESVKGPRLTSYSS
tara:strand:- start:1755 stop:2102 length:348 start_codon:yes stop_codon:yes gene_type:complete